jgi:hypothetical protein
MTNIISQPIKFLGATVLSFNSTLGLGSVESTLTVDLIEDCEATPPDAFWPINNLTAVGAPVYFDTTQAGGGFTFNGVLSTWTVNQSSGGKTFNVRVVDPRQLLENTAIIIDTYLGDPIVGVNYINVYAAWEKPVLDGNCAVFGTSQSGERGMPYQKIIEILQGLNPTIYSPTGYPFTIDFTTFPSNLPEYYRVAGPSISLLQLLQDVCDVSGYDFYVYLSPGELISIGLIDLKSQPTDFGSIIAAYNGTATELSYGQELRNEKTKAVLFGEKVHYLSAVSSFDFYFGEDLFNGEYYPVVPFKTDDCGFWINKRIDQVNLSLEKPFVNNGPYTISEMDIRSAMASYQVWINRVMEQNIPGGFNSAIRTQWPEAKENIQACLKAVNNLGPGVQAGNGLIDRAQNPNAAGKNANMPDFTNDLQKLHAFIKGLGDTFYGKQFITPLNQRICYYQSDNFGEKVFTDIPTPDGGWANENQAILGLNDPDLGIFRHDDNRVGCFAVFSTDGQADAQDVGADGDCESNPPPNESCNQPSGDNDPVAPPT